MNGELNSFRTEKTSPSPALDRVAAVHAKLLHGSNPSSDLLDAKYAGLGDVLLVLETLGSLERQCCPVQFIGEDHGLAAELSVAELLHS